MRTISVTMSITLDGVVQGLGRPDEDTRDGFTHGGWGPRYQDEVMGREMGRGMSQPTDIGVRDRWFLGSPRSRQQDSA